MGEKRLDFASTFVSLGVQISFERFEKGWSKLENKPGRLGKTCDLIPSRHHEFQRGFVDSWEGVVCREPDILQSPSAFEQTIISVGVITR